jgi:predicted amidophosphoribosyltransferase
MREGWRDDLAREGLLPVEVAIATDAEHPPCPACGTAAPLVEGACSDCGLQLE